MGIGTSKGAFYEDQFHYEAAQWDPKYDDNVVTPNDMRTNQQLEAAELDPTTGLGLEVGMKSQMPFPDNRNPETDFKNRFPDLPPSGILNDLKKPDGSTVPLVRKIDYKTASPLVNITDEDIDKAINIGSAASGGLITKAETVGKAALRYGKDVFEDANHGLALNKLLDKHDQNALVFHKIEEGFTTSNGRFVDRYEAAKIAKTSDQVKGHLPDDVMLLSEDLK